MKDENLFTSIDFTVDATGKRVELPIDALGRLEFAESLLLTANHIPNGSVIALQGGWGTGKTYVLASVFNFVSSGKSDLFDESPIWLNPWRYSSPDLLTPLVIEMLKRVGKLKESTKSSIRKAVESLIRSGLILGQKVGAAIATVSGQTVLAGTLNAGAVAADKLIEGLFKALDLEDQDALMSADPTGIMADKFRELVSLILAERKNKRILVCVDDLDRCLPSQQLAFLESIRFLTSSQAAVNFVAAIDPRLAHAAINSRYESSLFDPDKYLDKIFHVRLDVPTIEKPTLKRLIDGNFGQMSGGKKVSEHLKVAFGEIATEFSSYACESWATDSLSNPRVVQKLSFRLLMLAIHKRPTDLLRNDPLRARLFLAWIGIGDRWPQVRRSFRQTASEDRSDFIRNLFEKIVDGKDIHNSAIEKIVENSDLRQTLSNLKEYVQDRLSHDELALFFGQVERSLEEIGYE